jgi:cellulose synthase/poly-beta-1,6-N-acetylglucosamine synthase-like glycosyltransferase
MILSAQIFILVYCLFLIIFIYKWLTNNKLHFNEINKYAFVSLIIPIRNEAKNILSLLNSIAAQTYSHQNFEVIIVDDNSTDTSLAIIEDFRKNIDFEITIILLSAIEQGESHKKHAISQAVKKAKGEYVFATDGDCVLPIDLLKIYNNVIQNAQIEFIAGPVTFLKSQGGFFDKVWVKIQTVEFASLIGSAAVAFFLKKPNMCSGANIFYRKQTFFELNGFEGNMQVPSGDDEFLMHKFAHKYPDKVIFLKDNNCLVETQANDSLNTFYQQRKRWASKWNSYSTVYPTILAAFIFFVNVAMLYLIVNGDFYFVFSRVVLEFIFLSLILVFLKRKSEIYFIFLVQFFYPFYVIFIALSTLFGSKTYIWKSRTIK